MAEAGDRATSHPDKPGTVSRKPAEAQARPGEVDVEAAPGGIRQNAGLAPGPLAAALTGTDGTARMQILSRLQRERGNAYVQRVIAAVQSSPQRRVQRWVEPHVAPAVDAGKIKDDPKIEGNQGALW